MGKENKEKQKNPEKQIVVYKILVIILLLICIAFAGKWGYDKYIEYKSEKMYDDMANEVNNEAHASVTMNTEDDDASENVGEADTQVEDTQVEDSEESTEQTPDLPDDVEIPKKNLKWKKLHKTNPDIYAWIYIPNTKVDYPILQSATDDTYYLNHNIDGSKGYPGCIYTESINYKDFFDFNTIIYGHNMKSGQMFRTLHDFEKEEFFVKNKYAFIYTEEGTYVYEIYAAYTSDDSHILYTNDYSTDVGMQAYLDEAKTKAQVKGHLREDVEVTIDSKIITLSTCTSQSDERYLVQAVRLN